MADTKRQSVASGKTNNTNAGAKGAVSTAELSRALGSTIRISTTLPSHTLEGTLFALDPSQDLLALRSSTSFHVAPLSQISSFKILSQAVEEEAVPLGKVDVDALRQREVKAVAEAKRGEARIGSGVSREAQEIFNHISRTLPARWAETKIVVSDSVIIEAPYGVENVKAPADKKVALAQIKRVVDGYWTKKATGKSGSSTPVGNGPPVRVPVPNVPRKGG